MSTNRSFTMSKLLLVAFSALVLSSASARAEVVGFIDNFDGPDLDPAWSTSGDASNHLGFSGGLYSMSSRNGDVVPTGTSITRGVGGTIGDFTASLTLQADPFHDPDNSSADFKWKFFGPDGFTELVWNSFDNARLFHNDSSTATGGNLVTNVSTGFTDGDSIEFQWSYDSTAEIVSLGYSLNGGSANPIYSGAGNGDGFGNFFTNTTQLEVFQFGNLSPTDPIISVDQYSVGAVAVPEPGSFAMLASAVTLLSCVRRRRPGSRS